MCGLCGMISTTHIYNQDAELFQSLQWVTTLRGFDSTGMMAFDKNGNFQVEKTVGPTPELLKRLPPEMISKTNPDIRGYMSHHRWATKGDVTAENAHPFDTGRYIGAHNGTMKGGNYLHKKKTDSEILFEEIENKGLVKTLTKLANDPLGHAYALTMWDKKSKDFIFYRNHHRPLFLATPKTIGGVLFWASEEEALRFVDKRSEIPLSLEVERVPIYTLVRINPKTLKRTTQKIERDVKKEIPPLSERFGPPWDNEKDPNEDPPVVNNRDWGTCDICHEIKFGEEYKSSNFFSRNGKVRLICARCQTENKVKVAS